MHQSAAALKSSAWCCAACPCGPKHVFPMGEWKWNLQGFAFGDNTGMLAVVPLGPLGCRVGSSRISFVPAHPGDAWLDWDLGCLGAVSMPWASCCLPQAITEQFVAQHIVLLGGACCQGVFVTMEVCLLSKNLYVGFTYEIIYTNASPHCFLSECCIVARGLVFTSHDIQLVTC